MIMQPVSSSIIELNSYIDFINKEGNYAGEIEIRTVSYIYNINILVLRNIIKYKGYVSICKFGNSTE